MRQGTVDQMAWVWLFVSIVGIGAAVAGIVVATSRRKKPQPAARYTPDLPETATLRRGAAPRPSSVLKQSCCRLN